ncbi:hypothetical protein EWM64_g623 [Hericium alpestre]|uniref:Uncharacterized protein n=1 Tax=Hericium alpestre TaxID=135208 RepID=A0A4Z0AAP0_9AGAM|nr:hypothetical protein EWM64_g623 [Hericium alpestre]
MQVDLADEDLDFFNGLLDGSPDPITRLLESSESHPACISTPFYHHSNDSIEPDNDSPISSENLGYPPSELLSQQCSSHSTDADAEGETEESSFHTAVNEETPDPWAGTTEQWPTDQWDNWNNDGQWPQTATSWEELLNQFDQFTDQLQPEEPAKAYESERESIAFIQRVVDDSNPSIEDRQRAADWFIQVSSRSPDDNSQIEFSEVLMLAQRVFGNDKNSWKPVDSSGGTSEYLSPFPQCSPYTAALWHQHSRYIVRRSHTGRLPESTNLNPISQPTKLPLPIWNPDSLMLNLVNVNISSTEDFVSVRQLLLLS